MESEDRCRSSRGFSYTKTVPDYSVPAAKRVVVVPDVHRDLRKARACLRVAGLVDDAGRWIGGSAVAVQVGDQVDGGERKAGAPRRHVCGEATREDVEVLRFFNRLHAEARASGGAVYSLAGNHELMNVYGDFSYAGTDGCEACETRRWAAFRPGGAAARAMATSRLVVLKVGRVVFCHAGLLPWHVRAMRPPELNRVFSEFLVGNPVGAAELELLRRATQQSGGALFNRGYSPWDHVPAAEMDAVLRELDADHMVVGHNAHSPGVTPLHGGRAWVVDPGMSRAVLDGRPAALEISESGGRASFRVLR